MLTPLNRKAAVFFRSFSAKKEGKSFRATLIRILISSIAIYLIFRSIDGSAVLSLIGRANLFYISLAIAVIFMTRFLMAWKWKLLLHHAGIEQPLLFLLKTIIVSSFVGFFLPSSVGVDVIRTVAVGRWTGYAAAAVSTIADRIVAIITMVLWSSIAAGFALWAFPDATQTLWIALALCFCISIAILVLLSKNAVRLVQWIGSVGRLRFTNDRKKNGAGKISRLYQLLSLTADKTALLHDELRSLLAKPQASVSAFLLNALVQWARIVLFYLLFLASDIHVPFIYHIIFVPIIMFLTLLPVSFLGIGIKEGACVYFYSQVGVDPASALTISLWTYFVALPVLITGGLLFLLGALPSPHNPGIHQPRKKDGI